MSSWEKELYEAVWPKNDLSLVKAILARDEVRKNGNLGRKEWKGDYFPFHRAAGDGRSNIVQAMVEAGLEINSDRVYLNDNYRMTSLHWAVWGNRADTVKVLLDLGADPSLQGQWKGYYTQGTALEWARQKPGQHVEVQRILEEYIAKPQTPIKPPKPASLSSFEAMDSVAKLMQKPLKVKELDEAKRIQKEIKDKKEQNKTLEEKIKKDEEEMRNNKIKLKAAEEDLKKLEKQPSFLYMDDLKKQLEEIKTIKKSLKEVMKKKERCPVCLEPPQQVFNCQECGNWVCQECKSKIETSCPSCRQDLVAKPLVRSIALERHMGIP